MGDCKQAAGVFVPVIDPNRCEGKGPCVEVCPYAVLQIYTLPPAARKELSWVGKLKGFVHKWQQAEVLHPDLCKACGLCVSACPEKAITLARASAS